VIQKKNRFKGHNSVARVRGASVHFEGGRVFARRRKYGVHFRMAVVVSKKTAKSAVVRNRIRRRLYEAVRQSKNLNCIQGVDCVFVVRDPALADAPYDTIKKTINSSLLLIQKKTQ